MVTPTHKSDYLIQNCDLFLMITCANLSHVFYLWTKLFLILILPWTPSLFNFVVREIYGFLALNQCSALDHQLLVT